jgi:hypothetical protein
MLIWDDAITICQKTTNDNSADALTYLKMLMNHGYKTLLASFGRSVTEETKTALTVEDQQYYQMPRDFLWLKSLTITVGDTVYPIFEEESQENWNLMNMTTQTSSIPRKYFVKRRFGIGGDEIGLWPIPSTADYTLTMVYETTDRDLAQTKYTTGTATVTNNSASVVGIDTVFTAAMIGRYFNITDSAGDGMWYRVSARSSNLGITLENVYEGTTLTGNYQIAEAFSLPEDLQTLPIHYALYFYFSGKGNKEKMSEHMALFNQGYATGRTRYGTKSRDPLLRGKGLSMRGSNPIHFPESITS